MTLSITCQHWGKLGCFQLISLDLYFVLLIMSVLFLFSNQISYVKCVFCFFWVHSSYLVNTYTCFLLSSKSPNGELFGNTWLWNNIRAGLFFPSGGEGYVYTGYILLVSLAFSCILLCLHRKYFLPGLIQQKWCQLFLYHLSEISS